jgi:organic radical activating enzyme
LNVRQIGRNYANRAGRSGRRVWGSLLTLAHRLRFNPEARFHLQLASWKPVGRPPVVAFRWMMTQLCPYSCAYCRQRHKLTTVNGKSNHAFRNYPVAAWLEAFAEHSRGRRCVLTITGGEPMADRKSIISLLNGLSALKEIEHIRIDTNAYWTPERYDSLDRSKLFLNCAYHPEMTSEDAYLGRMRRIVDAGFQVSKVNLVIWGNHKEQYDALRKRFRGMGIPIHPNTDYNAPPPSKVEMKVFEGKVPTLEMKYRVRRSPPLGKLCLYPSVAYELDFGGKVWVACFPALRGSFFDRSLPIQPGGPVSCPSDCCYCVDRHSLLQDADPERGAALNVLEFYSRELLELQDRGCEGRQ